MRQWLHEGTLLTLPEGQWRISTSLHGPIGISATEAGQLIYRQGNHGPRPINRIAKSIE